MQDQLRNMIYANTQNSIGEEKKLLSTEVVIQKAFTSSASGDFPLKTFILNSQKHIKCVLEIIFDRYASESVLRLKFEKKVEFIFLTINLKMKGRNDPLVFEMYQQDKQSHYYKSKYRNIFKIHGEISKEIRTRQLLIQTATIFYQFAEDFSDTLINILRTELRENRFSDLTITVNKKKFQVNKFVLYYRSPVFKNMINTDMQEKQTNNINFPDLNPVVVREFLNYLYTNECDFSVGVHDIFKLAHMYEIEDLQIDCENYMLNNIKISDITDTLKLISLDYNNKLDVLKIEVEKFINTNESILMQNENFISYYLKTMNSDNIDLMLALAMEHNNENFTLCVKEYIRKNFEEVFKNIKFRNLLFDNPSWGHDIFGYFMKFQNEHKNK